MSEADFREYAAIRERGNSTYALPGWKDRLIKQRKICDEELEETRRRQSIELKRLETKHNRIMLDLQLELAMERNALKEGKPLPQVNTGAKRKREQTYTEEHLEGLRRQAHNGNTPAKTQVDTTATESNGDVNMGDKDQQTTQTSTARASVDLQNTASMTEIRAKDGTVICDDCHSTTAREDWYRCASCAHVVCKLHTEDVVYECAQEDCRKVFCGQCVENKLSTCASGCGSVICCGESQLMKEGTYCKNCVKK